MYKYLFASVLLTFGISTFSNAANLPDGIKGIVLGMKQEQVEATLDRVSGGKARTPSDCKPLYAASDAVDICKVDTQHFSYAGLRPTVLAVTYSLGRVSGISMFFIGDSLAQKDANLRQLTGALGSLLPMPKDVLKDDLSWKLDNDGIFLIFHRDTGVSLMYTNLAAIEQHKELERKAKAAAADL